jgi:single-strand DNA-binding protein
MSDLNRVIVLGNVGKEPEIRSTNDGSRIATFSLATNERWRDRGSGEQRDRAEWHRIVVFNDKLAEIVEKYVRKGSRLLVEGKLQTRKWTDNAGADRYTTEIVVAQFGGSIQLQPSSNGGAERAPAPSGADDYGSASRGGSGSANNGGVKPVRDDLDDEIPF